MKMGQSFESWPEEVQEFVAGYMGFLDKFNKNVWQHFETVMNVALEKCPEVLNDPNTLMAMAIDKAHKEVIVNPLMAQVAQEQGG